MTTPESADSDPISLEDLQRWQDFGGTWQVLSRSEHNAVISLRRCDGGEEVQRVVIAGASLLAWLGDRDSSDEAR